MWVVVLNGTGQRVCLLTVAEIVPQPRILKVLVVPLSSASCPFRNSFRNGDFSSVCKVDVHQLGFSVAGTSALFLLLRNSFLSSSLFSLVERALPELFPEVSPVPEIFPQQVTLEFFPRSSQVIVPYPYSTGYASTCSASFPVS